MYKRECIVHLSQTVTTPRGNTRQYERQRGKVACKWTETETLSDGDRKVQKENEKKEREKR